MGSLQALSSRGHLLNRLKLLPPGRLVAVAPVAGVSACLQAVHANPLRGALPLLIGEIRKFPNARLLGCRVCDCTAHCHISYSFFIHFLYSLLPFYIQSFISSIQHRRIVTKLICKAKQYLKPSAIKPPSPSPPIVQYQSKCLLQDPPPPTTTTPEPVLIDPSQSKRTLNTSPSPAPPNTPPHQHHPPPP